MNSERVEFLDVAVSDADSEDVLDHGGDRGPGWPRWWWLLVGVVVLAGVLTAAVNHRGPGAVGSTATRSTAAAPGPVSGVIAMPAGIGRPWQLVTAQSGDVVWMLDRGAGIVRIEDGRVTGEQLLEAQATALAVSPDGRTLYAAAAGDAPMVQEMDASTLALGPSFPLPYDVEGLAVSVDAVWVAAGGELLRLGVGDFARLGAIPLPGVLTVDHLRVDFDRTSGHEVLTALVTTDSTGGRLLGVDGTTGVVTVGPALPGTVTVASGQLLTWVSWTPPGESINDTEGFVTPGDSAPTAGTATVIAGSRIYDGGNGYTEFYVVQGTSHVVRCHDNGGFPQAEIDIGHAVAGATVTGQVLRTDTAFYAVTDRGLVRTGLGSCS